MEISSLAPSSMMRAQCREVIRPLRFISLAACCCTPIARANALTPPKARMIDDTVQGKSLGWLFPERFTNLAP